MALKESGVQGSLGVTHPWKVVSFDVPKSAKRGTLRIGVEMAKGAKLSCPKCGKPAPFRDKKARKWRHLDSWQHKTMVTADVPRTKCPKHGVRQVGVPWAGVRRRHTHAFEAEAAKMLEEMPVSGVAKLLDLSWNVTNNIKVRSTKSGRGKRNKGRKKA